MGLADSVMRLRWYLWVVGLVPLMVGAWSLLTSGDNLRSSGFLSGVGVTFAIFTALLILRKPWRHSAGRAGQISMVAVGLVGVVSVLALVGGSPEFLEERGLFVSVDTYGPRAVVAIDGGFAVVGDDQQGAAIWHSQDGLIWSRAPHIPSFDGLEVRDAIVFEGLILVVGQPPDAAEALVLTSSEGRTWASATRFGSDEFGIRPGALARWGGNLVLVADTYENDVAFFQGTNPLTWGPAGPLPTFENAEVHDVACHDLMCVAVGKDLATDSGVMWTSTSGEQWSLADGPFANALLTGVAQSSSGFVVVGTDLDEEEPVVWRSPNAIDWERADASSFASSTVDGIGMTGTGYVVFGRDLATGSVLIWLSEEGLTWERVTVDDSLVQGSEIRSVVSANGLWVAVGINTDLGTPVIWTSLDGRVWDVSDAIAGADE